MRDGFPVRLDPPNPLEKGELEYEMILSYEMIPSILVFPKSPLFSQSSLPVALPARRA